MEGIPYRFKSASLVEMSGWKPQLEITVPDSKQIQMSEHTRNQFMELLNEIVKHPIQAHLLEVINRLLQQQLPHHFVEELETILEQLETHQTPHLTKMFASRLLTRLSNVIGSGLSKTPTISLIGIATSDKPAKKLMAIFGVGSKTKKVYFGDSNYDDYTDFPHDNAKRSRYLKRHSKEDWTDPMKPGTLSAYILWGPYTNLLRNIGNYKAVFFG